MARSLQKELTPDNPEQCPMPSPPLQGDPVSLVGPPAQVEQQGPRPDIVIGKVDPNPGFEPDPEPAVTFGDDRSITIR